MIPLSSDARAAKAAEREAAKIARRTSPGGRFYLVEECRADWPAIPSLGLAEAEGPSVTTILDVIDKPALKFWAANIERAACVAAAREAMDEAPFGADADWLERELDERLGKTRAHVKASDKAKDIGSNAHAIIEAGIRRQLGLLVRTPPALTDEAARCVTAFEGWAKEHDMRPVEPERTVWNRELRYSGTADLLAEVDGVLVVVDWKTSKLNERIGTGIYQEMLAQVSAYAAAVESMDGRRPGGLVVRLPKTAEDAERAPFETRFVTADEAREDYMPGFRAAWELWAWKRKYERR